MAMASLNQDFVIKAPIVTVVYADQKISSTYHGHRGETLHYLQDTAAATQNIILTALRLGLELVGLEQLTKIKLEKLCMVLRN